MDQQDAKTYVMGRDAQEYERLRRQADRWEPATARLLDRAGLAPGNRCLDVGYGTGAVMELMASRVGPTGQVVGLDIADDQGATAAARSGGRVVRADVQTDDDVVPAGGFDLVFGRLLLLHVTDPVDVLRRMWRWVAPGGVLVVQDYDLRLVDSYPATPVLDEWRRVFFGTYEAVGNDTRIGTRLPALFAEAGIGAPDDTDVTGLLGTMAETAGMLTATYRSISPIAVAKHIITERQRDEWLAAISETERSRPELSVLWPLLVGAVKRR